MKVSKREDELVEVLVELMVWEMAAWMVALMVGQLELKSALALVVDWAEKKDLYLVGKKVEMKVASLVELKAGALESWWAVPLAAASVAL